MYQRKNFKNRLIFGEDKDNHKVGRFLGHSVKAAPPQQTPRILALSLKLQP